MGNVYDYQVGETVPLELNYKENGLPVTGLSVDVEIRDTATNKYLDFADDTWKSSGWTTKSVALNDIGNGQYQYMWDSSSAITADMIVSTEYDVTTSNYQATDKDVLMFGIVNVDTAAIAAAVWNRQMDQHTIDGSFGKGVNMIFQTETGRWKIENNQMIFYKEDNVTEVMRFNLYDHDGNPSMSIVADRQRVDD